MFCSLKAMVSESQACCAPCVPRLGDGSIPDLRVCVCVRVCAWAGSWAQAFIPQEWGVPTQQGLPPPSRISGYLELSLCAVDPHLAPVTGSSQKGEGVGGSGGLPSCVFVC